MVVTNMRCACLYVLTCPVCKFTLFIHCWSQDRAMESKGEDNLTPAEGHQAWKTQPRALDFLAAFKEDDAVRVVTTVHNRCNEYEFIGRNSYCFFFFQNM